MEEFARLFGSLPTLVYHCFDRIVIRGHLPLLTRPENIVHFFRDVHAIGAITKDACVTAPPNTTNGSMPSPTITAFPLSGPNRAYARKTMCAHACGRWSDSSASA